MRLRICGTCALSTLLLGCEKLLQFPDPNRPWNVALGELSGRTVHDITLSEEHRILEEHIRQGTTDPLHHPYFMIGVLGCLLWSVAYVFLVRQGIKDRIHTLPPLAICLNFTWELMAVSVLPNPSLLWTILEWSWILIDIGLLALLVVHGPAHFKHAQVRRYFVPILVSTLGLCLYGQLSFVLTFGDLLGFMVAFIINLVMSVQFVFMYFERKETLLGLNYPAAWLKMFGTACTSIQCAVLLPEIRPDIPSWGFMHFVYVTIFGFDAIYVALLHRGRARLRTTSGKQLFYPDHSN